MRAPLGRREGRLLLARSRPSTRRTCSSSTSRPTILTSTAAKPLCTRSPNLKARSSSSAMTAHLVEATADRLWIVASGTVKSCDGDIESYRQDLPSDRSAKDRAPRHGRCQRWHGRETATSAPQPARQRPISAQASLRSKKRMAGSREGRGAPRRPRSPSSMPCLRLPTSTPTRPKPSAFPWSADRLAKRLAEVEEAWLTATAAFEDAEKHKTSMHQSASETSFTLRRSPQRLADARA